MKILPSLAVIGAAILWSFDSLLRQSLYAAPSFLIITLEHAIGAAVFLPFIISGFKQLKGFSQQTWGSLIWISVFGGILGTFFYTKALGYVGYIDLSVVVLLQKLQPFFAILLATIVLRERISKKLLGLALLAFVGGYLITFADLRPSFTAHGNDAIAALFAIGAAFCWGTSTVFGKQALQAGGFFFMTGLRLLFTALLTIVPLLALKQVDAVASLSGHQWLMIFAIVFSTGGLALTIYYYGLQRIPASHATLYELAWPLSALVLDRIINHTILAPTQYMGGLLLLGSLLLLLKEDRRRQEERIA